MGMSIEDIILELEEAKNYPVSNEAVNYALDTIHKYLLMQSDYESRLKADMAAMLTELQLEIEEIVKEEEPNDKKWATGLHYSEKLIQQKIDKLKEAEDGK